MDKLPGPSSMMAGAAPPTPDINTDLPHSFPPEAQQLLRQAQEAGEMDDEMEDDQATRRRGRPRGSKTLNAYITNDAERRKYFVKRIKAIRAQAETFARCTGGNILVVAVQGESGGLHHCGTAAFERFIRDERVAELMYSYLNEQPPANRADPATAEFPDESNANQETPEELLVSLIMARLDTPGLCIASQVCRAWRARCYMPDLWHTRFTIENGEAHVAAVENAFERVGVTSHIDWRALHRDRCIAEEMSPGSKLFSEFLESVPGFDSLRIMVLTLLMEPTERIDAIRWTIVEHLSQFGLNEMWEEADQMMMDGFQDRVHGFLTYLPMTELTFQRLEQYACMYHNWHVYDFLLTKARILVSEYRTAALLMRARMVFQDAYIPQTWLGISHSELQAAAATATPATAIPTSVDNIVVSNTTVVIPNATETNGPIAKRARLVGSAKGGAN